ncbi:TPA: hypothetical protein O1Z19_002631 [Staphylococcus aureus]|nr:hypothetical protein D9748_13395 [Staphylococcus aureus]HCY5810199.1 hypothetical protein [Staphylococcus aureus]HCY8046644.1 hypothetical protein [Staphylococcus aureus]
MAGPQHRGFRKEILQTMRVGVGPNTEADEKPAYNNVQVGGGGAPTQRISKRNSTNNASWGWMTK